MVFVTALALCLIVLAIKTIAISSLETVRSVPEGKSDHVKRWITHLVFRRMAAVTMIILISAIALLKEAAILGVAMAALAALIAHLFGRRRPF